MGLLPPMQVSMPLAADRRQREVAGWRDPTSCWRMQWNEVVLQSLTCHSDSISNHANSTRAGAKSVTGEGSAVVFLSPLLHDDLFASVLKVQRGWEPVVRHMRQQARTRSSLRVYMGKGDR